MFRIKGNETDVANMDVELLPKTSDKFVCFTSFKTARNIFATKRLIVMGFKGKDIIFNSQISCVETLKLNFAIMCLIPLDHATQCFKQFCKGSSATHPTKFKFVYPLFCTMYACT